MIEFVASSLMALTLTWFLASRTFHIADIYEARRHLDLGARPVVLQADTVAPLSGSRKGTTTVLDFANLCDSLARATRSGLAAHDAILINVQQHQFPHCTLLLLLLIYCCVYTQYAFLFITLLNVHILYTVQQYSVVLSSTCTVLCTQKTK